ncbi:MAG: NrdH-redoxin [Candidatus Sungbacteria bacterium RIFCSPLOWO2_01_FULL_59_16]|uniref:NrdH-redoxin n=1 Tax=Candidatus Sungbacteria bacterium RIFCSPLOWO2_01_FULL_59_16 TaxID=1802280 RepID=A0A1G2LD52_9BACT|nr:MAG: NrdH-redoxin [Candidatus Sungbacteria bacterium RIFCSPLOWO2_01_FULL_59_16]
MANVKIYTTPSCVFCKMTKAFFEANGIAYQEFNVASDAQAREEMITKSGQFGVPVTDIDGKLVIGFDRAGLAELLGIT